MSDALLGPGLRETVGLEQILLVKVAVYPCGN